MSTSTGPAPRSDSAPRFGRIDAALESVEAAIQRSRDYVFSIQDSDGFWCGELEADSMLEADYIFVHRFLGTGDEAKLQRALTEMLRFQNDDGSWSIYPGGTGNISLTVKCYFACKLMGWSQDEPILVKARAWILAHGGVVECNTFTKLYLCALGQYEYDAVPAVPPEIVLFPKWVYLNLYEISSWSRAILVPLSIAYAKKPFKKLPVEMNIDELFIGGRHGKHLHLKWSEKAISWRNFFLVLNRVVHFCERFNIRPLRYLALKKAERWMVERFEKADGMGAS